MYLSRRFFATLGLSTLILSCGPSQKPIPVDPSKDTVSELSENDDFGTHTEETSAVPRVADFTWDEAPLRQPLSETEKGWTGSIIAEVTSYHLNTGGVMFLNKSGKNDLVESTMDAIENDTRVTDRCVWLELYKDHTGFWYSCMMMDGPKVTEKIDVLNNNEKVTTGVMFDWYLKDKSLYFRFEKELEFTWIKDTTTQALRTRYWTIKLPSAQPKKSFKGTDIYPEYDYTSPIKNRYDFYDEHFYGKPLHYDSAIML